MPRRRVTSEAAPLAAAAAATRRRDGGGWRNAPSANQTAPLVALFAERQWLAPENKTRPIFASSASRSPRIERDGANPIGPDLHTETGPIYKSAIGRTTLQSSLASNVQSHGRAGRRRPKPNKSP